MGEKVCKRDPLIVNGCVLDKVIVFQGLRDTNRLKKLDQDFSEDVMVFNLSTDHECEWHKVRFCATLEVDFAITFLAKLSGKLLLTAVALIRFHAGSHPTEADGH